MKEVSFFLENENETVELGRRLAGVVSAPLVIYLTGELGAGKTTFSRGLIQSLGHQGAVKSPTYTLVEPYEINGVEVYHFDLYRLMEPEELEFMGIRDYFNDTSLCIVEWPDRGQGLLPDADLHLHLSYQDNARNLKICALSKQGEALLSKLK
ncbi:MAG: tRNA (adenosine(37)-N6)-threonylcarbamoyltransferase complex ATPase subunit type 1 TsaE [Shewanella sp.]|nr:tRNA (adenosine(37)-N6)-threonylcarbamoyltransferase complex ATPase subunit type 1 TsaE [Shewanella sp.]MCF1430693.1 tRNA (adenosine(37)-N6)-threonylcarbamoyltransferase complex ATPase subunit type 1 TsaE [Shewanella sp.]MCF1458214.1 tRNA (adenosine(37)-N6)-threonylcarbamoyltransferase complex ATPase subunit type 1 TsaE [Shewanella sp.]